jgi:23S rRNA (guanosine2251-2'-O)-methyltransferase
MHCYRLLSNGNMRAKDKSEIVYGLHAVRHALRHSRRDILEIWVQNSRQSAQAIREILRLADTSPVSYVSRQFMDQLTGHARHQGIAIRKSTPAEGRPASDLKSLLTVDSDTLPLYLVLDGVQDPHNLGACLRTADAAGVKALIVPRDRAAGLTPVVSKVSSGAAEVIPLIRVTNLARTLREMQSAGIWIIGTAGEAKNSIFEVDMNRPLALVLGAEGRGLRQNTRKYCDVLANIPMAGVVESLNVSVAASVCLYEAVRQRDYAKSD